MQKLKKLFFILLVFLFTASSSFAIIWSGGSSGGVTVYTVATLPGTAADGTVASVTDGADASDCTVGGGVVLNVCVYDLGGTAWVIAGDGAGSGNAFSTHNAPAGTDPAATGADTLNWVATSPITITGDSGTDTLTVAIPAATNASPGHATAAQITALEANTAKVIDDTAYNEATWNANSDAPTKNAVRDQIEAMPGTDDQTAAEVVNTPAGNIAATDVQAAIDELDDEKEPLLTNSAGLAAALNDETGTGLNVHQTSPTLITPALGTATATNVTSTHTDTCHSAEPTALLVVGETYCSDGGWDPTGQGLGIKHWVQYTDANPATWVLVRDATGKVYVSSFQITSMQLFYYIKTANTTLTTAEANGGWILANAAVDIELPDCAADTLGMNVCIEQGDASEIVSVAFGATSSDQYLMNGTEYGGATEHEIDSPGGALDAGSHICLICIEADYWRVKPQGTDWVDGDVQD